MEEALSIMNINPRVCISVTVSDQSYIENILFSKLK